MKRRVPFAVLPAIVLVVAAGTGDSTSAAPGASQTTRGEPWTGAPGVTVPVSTLMARQRTEDLRRAGQPPINREKPIPGGREARPQAQGGGSSRERIGRSTISPKAVVTKGTSFLGAQTSDTPGFVPPDTMGSVGPTQVVVAVNGRIKAFDKDGTPGALNIDDAVFWASERDGLDVTDPQVEYDRLSGRWILSQINFDLSDPSMVNNRIMVAVSSGPTITNESSFTFFSFQQNEPDPGATALFADYPQMGVDQNAVYIGTNDFDSTGGFASTTAFVIDKADLLANTLTVTAFRNLATAITSGPFSPQPAQDMVPSVSDGYIVGVDSLVFDQLDVVRIDDPGGTPSITQFTLSVPRTYFPRTVPAQGSNPNLDALDDRLFEAMIARNESGTPSLWTAHNIRVNSSGVVPTNRQTGDRDAARWYQIGSLSATPTLIQSGTLFDSTATSPRFFWIPSIAMNGQGHASLNSSTAGSGRFAEVASSGRLSTDFAGFMEPVAITQSSSSPYDDGRSYTGGEGQRWGDYSQTVVDPNDNMTFWTFQEYANATNSWGVRVIQLKAPPPATPTVANPNTIAQGDPSEIVQVTGTSASGSGFFDPGPDTGGPGFPNHISASVTGGVTVNSVTYVDPTHVTLDLNTTVAGNGSQDVTITNPDGQPATGQNILVVGSDTTPPAPPTFGGTIPASPANDNSPQVFGTAEGGSTVRLYTNATCTAGPVATGAAALFASGLTVSVPDNSTTTFFGTATDISNNTSDCSSTLGAIGSVTYVENSSLPPSGSSTPSAPPETTITKGPKKKTTKRRPKFKFTASEPGASFRCKLDRGAFVACSSPFRPPKLSLGKHVLKVEAVDAAGNVDPTPAVRKFRVVA